MDRLMMKTSRLAFLLGALLVVSAGCGGDDSGTSVNGGSAGVPDAGNGGKGGGGHSGGGGADAGRDESFPSTDAAEDVGLVDGGDESDGRAAAAQDAAADGADSKTSDARSIVDADPCPSTKPAFGAPCGTPNYCTYGLEGSCVCGFGGVYQWNCSSGTDPEAGADCPTSKPIDRQPCTVNAPFCVFSDTLCACQGSEAGKYWNCF
jgi:hypothetical protein